MPKKRILLSALLTLTITAGIALIYCDHAVKTAADGRLYSDTDHIPYRRTGLLLGTGKYIHGTHLNPYYYYRIEALQPC